MKNAYIEINGDNEKVYIMTTFKESEKINLCNNYTLFNCDNYLDGEINKFRQDLLGSCAKTILYILFLYKLRVKPLEKSIKFISIPYQRLVENSLVGKKTLYYYLDRYVCGLNYLSKLGSKNIKSENGNIFYRIIPDNKNKELVLLLNLNIIESILCDTNRKTSCTINWNDIKRFHNFFSIKMYLVLLNNYIKNKGQFKIKLNIMGYMLGLKFLNNPKYSASQKKKDLIKYYLSPFISKVQDNIIINQYSFTKDDYNNTILNIDYTIKSTKKRQTSSSPPPIHPSLYTTLDHHKVRSRAEAMIDDFLFHHKIRHIYEKRVTIDGETIVCDFYLPDYDTYIEFWGMKDKNYLKRKEEKIEFYKKNNLKLIGLEDKDLNNLDESLLKKLFK